MKPKTVVRLIGGAIILFNLWLIGQYRIEGVMVLVLTFGVAIAFELLIVRSLPNAETPTSTAVAAPPAATSKGFSPRPVAVRTEERHLEEPPKDLDLTEDHWKRALEEFGGSSRRAGLWGKSFADANGDEAIAKAKYLRARALELAQAEWIVARDASRAAKAKRLAEEEAARAAAQREYDAKPKDICPSCRRVILLNALECPYCHATFGKHAAWHVLHPGET